MSEQQNIGDVVTDDLEKVQWAVVVDGTPVTLLSLSPGVLGAIQRDTGTRWGDMLVQPMRDLIVMDMLVAACRAKVGVEHTPFDSLDSLVRLFVRIGDDLPPLDEKPASGVDPTPTT